MKRQTVRPSWTLLSYATSLTLALFGLGMMGCTAKQQTVRQSCDNLVVRHVPKNDLAKASLSSSQKLQQRAQIHATLHSQRLAYQNCYEQQLDTALPMPGDVRVAFALGNKGQVQRVQVVESTLSPQINRCLVRTIKKLSFPRSPGNNVTQVAYRFRFRRGGADGPSFCYIPSYITARLRGLPPYNKPYRAQRP